MATAMTPASGGFTPTVDKLTEVCNILALLRDPGNPNHQAATANLGNFIMDQNFVAHVVYAFVRLNSQQLSDDLRQLAGLILKQYCVKKAFRSYSPDLRAFVRGEILVALCDAESESTRRTAANVCGFVASRYGLEDWPDLLETLRAAMLSGNPGVSISSQRAMNVVVEDCLLQMNAAQVASLIHSNFQLFGSPHEELKGGAVECITQLIDVSYPPPPEIDALIPEFLTGLSGLAAAPSSHLRRLVCLAIIKIIEVSPGHVVPVFDAISAFAFSCLQDSSEDVTMVACEFWEVCCDCGQLMGNAAVRAHVQGLLPTLIPHFLRLMVHTPSAIAELTADDPNDEAIPDRPEDLRPMFAKGRGGGSKSVHQLKKEHDAGSGRGGGEDDGADDDNDDDGDDNYNDDEGDQWTARRFASSAVDKLSTLFGGHVVLPIAIPIIQENIGHENMWLREAAILGLGTIAPALKRETLPGLQPIMPFLLEQLRHPLANVRRIALWTIGRYIPLVLPAMEDPSELQPFVQMVCQSLLDTNKRTQAYACSTMSTLVDFAGDWVLIYLKDIVHHAVAGLRKYQIKSQIYILETIGAISDSAGAALATEELLTPLVQSLIEKYELYEDLHPMMTHIFEALSSVCAAAGMNMQSIAQGLFQRAMRVLEAVIIANSTKTDDSVDDIDTELGMAALDLISGLICGFGASFEVLAQPTNFLNALVQCMQCDFDEMRRAALGCVGDLAGNCPNFYRANVTTVLSHVVANIRIYHDKKVISNAVWSLGECAVAYGDPAVGEFVHVVVNRMCSIAADDECTPKILENICVSLGRLALVSTPRVTPLLDQVVQPLCLGLTTVYAMNERTEASLGMCLLFRECWDVCMAKAYFQGFFHAVASWHEFEPDVDPRLRDAIAQIMAHFCQQLQAANGPQAPQEFFAGLGSLEAYEYLTRSFMLPPQPPS